MNFKNIFLLLWVIFALVDPDPLTRLNPDTDPDPQPCLQEELKIKRNLAVYHDSRVHVCLYFICPTGHGLKSIDLVCMKKLDQKVSE